MKNSPSKTSLRKSRWGIAITASAALLAAPVIAAPVASADINQCPAGFSCVWTAHNYTENYSGRGNANYTEWYFGAGYIYNDTISSIRNNFQGQKIWYQHDDRGGAQLKVEKNTQISNLQNRESGLWYHPDWNDLISSVN